MFKSHRKKDTARCSKLQRKLVFDAINEIIDRNRGQPSWKLTESSDSVKDNCCEFQKIRKPETAKNLFAVRCKQHLVMR
ncbi:putative protein LONGIFOLIA [Helianthus annuus]|nr:putative protein LONGIFOLIA [Helianthus annuus]